VTLELGLDVSPRDRPLTVRELVEGARLALEATFPLVWVEGEISNFKAYPSGHWYFSLKDREAQLRCVMFRLDTRGVDAPPADGLKVFARGQLTVGVKRGELQLIVRQLLATAQGGFHAALLARARKALEKDGLLDPARKRPLPAFPRVVGVVTSPEGAAWRDIVAVVGKRWPAVELVLIPSRVQGDEAPVELRRALALASRWQRLDVLIVGRGGGSAEDLWAFNDEKVARAVAASPVPTISAVGHEIDVTLTDLVADARAPTPSAAAEKAVPDGVELWRHLAALESTLAHAAARRFELATERLSHAGSRMSAALGRRLWQVEQSLSDAARRIVAACRAVVEVRRNTLERLAAKLDALSPLRVLERGYAVARDASGRVLRRVTEFPPGRAFRLRVSDGEVRARAEGVTGAAAEGAT
jgi:exodeoxyribonuclease VII large subunit